MCSHEGLCGLNGVLHVCLGAIQSGIRLNALWLARPVIQLK